MQAEKFKGGWEAGPGECGAGSEEQYCLPDSNSIIEIIEALKEKDGRISRKPIINEAGCGDMFWLRYNYGYFKSAVDYMGYDITDRSSDWYSVFKFKEADMTTELMRGCDIIICRLVFIHLPNSSVEKSIKMFRRTGAKYLISDNFPTYDNVNRHDKPSFVGIPFNLRKLLKCVSVSDDKRVAVYEL